MNKKNKKISSIQPEVMEEIPKHKVSPCEGCTGCDIPIKSSSTRRLSDELPKAKHPRIKRTIHGSNDNGSTANTNKN